MKLRLLVMYVWELFQVVMARPHVPCFARSLDTLRCFKASGPLYRAPVSLSLSSRRLWAQTSAKRPPRHLSITLLAIFSKRKPNYPTSLATYLIPILTRNLESISRLVYVRGFGPGAWAQKCYRGSSTEPCRH